MKRRMSHDLIPEEELAKLPKMLSENWNVYGDRATKGRRYQLTLADSGDVEVWVIHCGHPTALWPYYIQAFFSPTMILAPNGSGFAYLRDAKLAAWKAYWEHVRE